MIAFDSTNDFITTGSSSSHEPQPTMTTSSHRHVRFECDENNVVHEDEEPMSSLEFQAYFMQRKDYERCDKDINESVKKWMQFQAGRILFDEERFSVRGVEGVINHMKCMHCPKNQSRIQQTRMQIRAVLRACKQQPHDVEHTRIISQSYSKAALDLALRTAERDASFVLYCSATQQPNTSNASSCSRSKHADQEECAPPMHKDKKARLGQRFSFLRKRAASPPFTTGISSLKRHVLKIQ